MNSFFNAFKQYNKPIYLSSLFISVNMAYVYRSNIWSLIMNTIPFFKETPRKIQNILTDSEDYFEKKKTRFLSQYQNIDVNNENIEKAFYNKDLYKAAIQDEDNELELRWKRRLLIETTPRGNIYMYYDVYKLGFAYYTDSSSLPYSILNAVAMKYCSAFKCLDLFVDQTIIPTDKQSPLIKIHHIDEKTQKQIETNKKIGVFKTGPFVKFKTNSATHNENKKKDTNKKEEELITNKFINMGKIYNMKLLSSESKKIKSNFNSPMMDNLKGETKLQGQVMNYKEYKRQFDKENSQLEG